MTKTDREALQRALATAKAEDAGRREQLETMLREDGWDYVRRSQLITARAAPWA